MESEQGYPSSKSKTEAVKVSYAIKIMKRPESWSEQNLLMKTENFCL